VSGRANPSGSETDHEALARYGTELADAVAAALGGWVERAVRGRAEEWRPGTAEALRAQAVEAGTQATAEVGPMVRALLAADVDQQRTGPLALIRGAVRYPTEVLASARVPAVARDEFEERAFPEDVYGLAPASFADVDPALQGPGLVWGAAKAHVVLARRRAEGLR